MNYQESREYIQKISKYGSVLGLQNIMELLKRLGNPQDEQKVVHFAGTNGKGSTITYTESILMQAGYRVGKYTSPAVFNPLEVFQWNGKNISEEAYAEHMSAVKQAADGMVHDGFAHPTPFEVETALAFLYFQKNQCDIVLLETGMGGATDATNVMEKVLCSVIVSISRDHTQFLGNTLEEIAAVKAGIIKQGCPVVLAKQGAAVTDVVKSVAKEKEAELIITERPYDIYVDDEGYLTFSYIHFPNMRTKMMGAYQPENVAVAMETALVLEKQGYRLKEYIRKGIENAVIPGRFERISEEPLMFIDGAHNPDAALRLRETLQMYFTNKRIAIIMGVLADKNYEEVARAVASLGVCVITVSTQGARALEAEVLREAVEKYNPQAEAAKSI